MPAWMQTYGGGAIDLLNPTPDMIAWEAVSVHLSKITRFTGATKGATVYSVAEHCLHMAEFASPELKPYVLLHDAHEAFTNDISSPMKIALSELGGGGALDKIVDGLDKAIYAKAGLSFPISNAIKKEVKRLDLEALSTERKYLMHDCKHKIWIDLPEPWPIAIFPGTSVVAANAYYGSLLRHLPALRSTVK